jgi:hypothetical protein
LRVLVDLEREIAMTTLSRTHVASVTPRPRRPLVTLIKGMVAGMFLGGARCGGPGYDLADDDDTDASAYATDAGDGAIRDSGIHVDDLDASDDADVEEDAANAADDAAADDAATSDAAVDGAAG